MDAYYSEIFEKSDVGDIQDVYRFIRENNITSSELRKAYELAMDVTNTKNQKSRERERRFII